MFNGKPLKILTIIQYAALLVATIGVLVFQFIPHEICMYLSLGLYALGFLIIMLRNVLTTIEIFIASLKEQRALRVMVETSRVQILNTIKERIWSVITSLFWVAVFGFSLSVLIMYILAYPVG